jgi:TonB family protein
VAKVEGTVHVLIAVDPDGRAADAHVLKSVPYGVFDAEVLNNAKQTRVTWKGAPPTERLCGMRIYKFEVQ